MDTTTPTLEIGRTVELLVASASWLTEKLDALTKRGAKLSVPCTPRLVMVGEPRSNWHPTANQTERELCIAADVCKGGVCPMHWEEEVLADYLIEGSLPVLPGGWRLLAAVDHDPILKGVIIREAPGEKCPPEFRSEAASKRCDHCHVQRHRKTCYVLQSAAGEVLQVGSTCVADYLRSTDVEATIDALLRAQGVWAAFWEKVRSGEIDLETCGGRGEKYLPLTTLLSHVAAIVRENKGRYVTRKIADESAERGDPMMTTADIADRTMSARSEKEKRAFPDLRTAIDLVEAESAIEWAKGLLDGSAFEENLRTYAKAGLCPAKGLATAAYIVPAFARATRPPIIRVERKETPVLKVEVKERITIDVELIRRASYEVQFGMRPTTMYVSIMRKIPLGSVTGDALTPTDDDGAIIVWKSQEVPMVRSGVFMGRDSADNERGKGHWVPADVGDRVRISAIVKKQETRAHGKNKPEPQTVVTHLKTLCDGWGYSPREGFSDPEAIAFAAEMIATGRNRPIEKTAKKRTTKKKAA